MPDKDMADMVKSLIEQYKVAMEMIKFLYDINETPGPSNLAKRPSEIQQQSSQIKVTKFNGSYFKVAILAALRGSCPKEALVLKAMMYRTKIWIIWLK